MRRSAGHQGIGKVPHRRLPLHREQGGTLALPQPSRHEGILGTVYTGELVREVPIAGRAGVVPTISGQAWITGYTTHVLDADDPFPNGLTIGDI